MHKTRSDRKNHVLPAYQLLIDGLTDLKGTGKNSVGLANFDRGKEYYEYLVKSSTGCFDPVPELENGFKNSSSPTFRSSRR